jgi:ATP-dependent DNA helicase RecQ
VLKGDVQMLLRQPSETPKRARGAGKTTGTRGARGKDKAPPIPLDADATARFEALKAWRAEVAREHNLPAYIVFHDAALAEMAQAMPDSLDALGQISGVGAKKLEAYGREILRVLGD